MTSSLVTFVTWVVKVQRFVTDVERYQLVVVNMADLQLASSAALGELGGIHKKMAEARHVGPDGKYHVVCISRHHAHQQALALLGIVSVEAVSERL